MLKFILSMILITVLSSSSTFAQDTLPKISVITENGKTIISWRNTYGATISNINIQRSTDSLKRFTTIGTVLNSSNSENGYVDTKMPPGKIFYRVFVAFEGGDYIFSKSYRPVIDTTTRLAFGEEFNEDKKDPKLAGLVGFVPSKFVFTGKDNNVIINLPGAEKRKFSIKFYDEKGNPVFELKSIKEPYLILDKVNFLHAGWYKYDLLDNNILLEKYKFLVPKDGKNSGREQKR